MLADPAATPLDVVWNAVPTEATSYVRGQLGRVLFSGDDVAKKVGALSGGEAARLVFCRIMVEQPNVLVLDEPTNHLDLEAIHALVGGAPRLRGGARLRLARSRVRLGARDAHPRGHRRRASATSPARTTSTSQRGDDHLDADAVVLRAKKEQASAAPGQATSRGRSPGRSRSGARTARSSSPRSRDAAVRPSRPPRRARRPSTRAGASRASSRQTPAAEIAALEEEEKALGPRIDALIAEWEALEKEIEDSRE